jgi:hypothetical protein
MKRRTIDRLVIAFLFVATCVVFAERVSRPPAALPVNSTQSAFSAQRAMKNVLAIAKRSHPIGSAEHDRIRDYLIAQLSILGLEPQVQNATGVDTRYADNLSKSGGSLGWVSAVDCNGRTIWIADAHRGDGKRFIVHADEKLTAFLELEAEIRGCGDCA